MSRFLVCFIFIFLVLNVTTTATNLYGQELETVVLTEEEILKELKSSPLLKGEILYGGKVVFSFSSDKGNLGAPTRMMEPGKLSEWIHTNREPTFIIKFTEGDDPNRLFITTETGDTSTKKYVIWEASKKKKGEYLLSFSEPLQVGTYEFAIKIGELICFIGYGFHVDE